MRGRPRGAGAAVLVLAVGGLSVVASALLLGDVHRLFAEHGLAARPRAVVLGYVFLYELACAVFWPTPSEAPLLLYRQVPLAWIILACSAGKGCGAYLVCRGWRGLDAVLAPLGLARVSALRDRVRERLARGGFAAYFLMQALPFLPMRTAIYVYASVAGDWRPVVAGAAIGTACRSLLMLAIVAAGYLSWTRIG
jgi:uncharacterized membrane protein YdjX (TVP38/TMEM64 family)